MPSQKIPKHGWVQELGDAEFAAERSRSAGAQLRLAIASRHLISFISHHRIINFSFLHSRERLSTPDY
jgi:hypothetical protein